MAKSNRYKEYSTLAIPDEFKVVELLNIDFKQHLLICRKTIDEHSDDWNRKSLDQKLDQYDPEIGGFYWEDLYLNSISELLYYYDEEGYTIRDYTKLFPDFLSNNMIYWYNDLNTNETIIVTAINDQFNFVVCGVKNDTGFGVSYKDFCELQFVSIKRFEELTQGITIKESDWQFIMQDAQINRNGSIPCIKYFDTWYALAMFND